MTTVVTRGAQSWSYVPHTMPARTINGPTTSATTYRLAEALATLTGPGVGSAVGTLAAAAELVDGEKVLPVPAVPGRGREFAAGRRCARAALRDVGCGAGAIGRGRLEEPLWPAGFEGSITHGRAFAAAIAYRTGGGNTAWGVDLVDEPDSSRFGSIRRAILSDAEAHELGDGARELSLETIATAFSAKEAAIKIISPRLRRYVAFLELEVARSGSGLVVHGPLGEVVSRSAWTDGVLVTVALSASRASLERW
jgi:4'-phosphopantetheinyl transferase EntD